MDRRTKYTKKIIKETLLEMLKAKDINKITVSGICSKADINRATFYRYYIDIYDLLDKIQQDFIEELKETSYNKDYTVFTFSKDMLQVCLNNKDLLKVIFKTQSNIYFLHDFLEIGYQKCKEKWKSEVNDLDEESIDYAAVFIYNGALGVINYWIQNDFEEPVDKISLIIEQLSYDGIKKFLYN